jgi:hypothetical protein
MTLAVNDLFHSDLFDYSGGDLNRGVAVEIIQTIIGRYVSICSFLVFISNKNKMTHLFLGK